MKIPHYEFSIFVRAVKRGLASTLSGSGAPVDATTGAGTLKKGGLYLRTSNDKIYLNVGTKASPRFQILN